MRSPPNYCFAYQGDKILITISFFPSFKNVSFVASQVDISCWLKPWKTWLSGVNYHRLSLVLRWNSGFYLLSFFALFSICVLYYMLKPFTLISLFLIKGQKCNNTRDWGETLFWTEPAIKNHLTLSLEREHLWWSSFQGIPALSLFLYDAAPVQAGSEALFNPKRAQCQFLFPNPTFRWWLNSRP